MSELVSVIVPTYMRSDKLERAIQSILTQTYDNIEIIVINDNEINSEESEKVHSLLEKIKYENIRIIDTPGAIGGGAARNLGCKKAAGEYLAFLDDDDVFLPDKIERQLDFMRSNDLEMCWQDVEWFDERERLVEHRVLDRFDSFSKRDLLRAHILTSLCPTAIYMLKKDLYLRSGGFGETKTGQDWFLMLNCIEADGKIGYMPGVYVKQYIHSGKRVSTGQNKIDGENYLFEYKRKYFNLLSEKEKKYVKFRHYAVLAFSYKRSKKYSKAVLFAIKTIITSPSMALEEAKRFFGGRNEQ